MKADLHNKIAVITGAAGGIGKACAKILLENSAAVIITDIQDEKGRQTIEEFTTLGTCRYLHADVNARQDVKTLIDTVLAEFGKIDIFTIDMLNALNENFFRFHIDTISNTR